MEVAQTQNGVAVSEPRTEAAVAGPACPVNEPGLLFFGANRRSGTTWLTAMLNAHPEVHMRNEGWLLNDKPGSSENWIDRERLGAYAGLKSAQGTWMKDMSVEEAALTMQRGMIRALMKEATIREGWKKWDRLKWMGDKTTTYYCQKIDLLHALFPPPGARFLYMVRDGRDVAVSDQFLAFRAGDFSMFSREGQAHARRAFDHHVAGKGEPVPLFCEETLRYFVNVWTRSAAGGVRAKELYGNGFVQVMYEELVGRTVQTLGDLFRWLGVDDDAGQVAEIVERNKFENFAEGRSRGQADPKAEWRKGVVGDWRNYFTEQDKGLFKRMAGSLLVEMGYEKDTGW